MIRLRADYLHEDLDFSHEGFKIQESNLTLLCHKNSKENLLKRSKSFMPLRA